MKLYEVIRRTQRVKEPLEDYLHRLDKMGVAKPGRKRIGFLGSGAYAHVYQHPEHEGIAVKVSGEEYSVLRYVRFALANQRNPYVPKIYDVHRFRDSRDDEEYFVIFMEKLNDYEGLRNQQKKQILRYHVGNLVDITNNFTDFFWEDSLKVLSYLRKHAKEEKLPLAQFLIPVLSYLYKNDMEDTHDANIMLRGSKQIVFTDPAV